LIDRNEIAQWFIREYGAWAKDHKLVSWAEKLGITLNCEGTLDEEELFHLFVLAVLWNNPPTYRTQIGEKIFRKIKDEYTLSNLKVATVFRNKELLEHLAFEEIGDLKHTRAILNLLMFIASENIWMKIKQILDSPKIGNEECDLERLRHLWDLFNSPRREAYLTIKIFLVFREIRIQFRDTGMYQYHPAICCIPDSHVRKALAKLKLIQDAKRTDFQSLASCSRTVAEHFCRGLYDLYDLPLFFWHKEVC